MPPFCGVYTSGVAILFICSRLGYLPLRAEVIILITGCLLSCIIKFSDTGAPTLEWVLFSIREICWFSVNFDAIGFVNPFGSILSFPIPIVECCADET